MIQKEANSSESSIGGVAVIIKQLDELLWL